MSKKEGEVLLAGCVALVFLFLISLLDTSIVIWLYNKGWVAWQIALVVTGVSLVISMIKTTLLGG